MPKERKARGVTRVPYGAPPLHKQRQMKSKKDTFPPLKNVENAAATFRKD